MFKVCIVLMSTVLVYSSPGRAVLLDVGGLKKDD